MLSLKMTEMWTTMGSTLASLMFIWAIIRQYCPYQLLRFFEKYSHRIMDYFYPYIRISFHEFLGDRLKRSDAYGAVEAYLSANTSKSAKRLKAEIGKDSTNLVLTMDEYERVTDDYKGVKVYWVCSKVMSNSRSMPYYQEQEKRFYKLTFHKKYRDTITGSYLDHVMKEGKEIRLRNRQRKLYTNSPGYKWPSYKQTMWSHIVFEHPATFETMAMEPEKKKEIIEDLVTFSKSKDFYARIGKAWKRGYLLFGPPGTGKSTMIAAMANLLGYDVYDLELTAVKDNTELRKLLIETTSKSIIVIEDIDCSLDLTGQRKKKGESKFFSDDENENKVNIDVLRKEVKEEGSGGGNSKVTLSGLLNFIDGIWSACGGERLIVFTTNYVEKLDPALIRRGRTEQVLQHEKIKPYTRKWETSVMDTIDELNLVAKKVNSGNVQGCDVQHDVPAVFFSNGGYTGNVYHEFNDGIIPLYITSQHFNKKVVFVILEYHSWWITKYGDILSHLSEFPPIDFSEDNRTHCFSEAIVGLKIHDELAVDSSSMEGSKNIVDFRNLLDKAYSPRIKGLIKDEEREAQEKLRQQRQISLSPSSEPGSKASQRLHEIARTKPKLVIVSRSGSRAITNENLLVKMAEEIGFKVKVLKPKQTTELAKIYRVLNESDVMIGVHGAAMTHFMFMKPRSVFIQVVPLGTNWAADTYYGEPARKLGLKYISYEIHPKESSLYGKYDKNDPILRDPDSITEKGWEYTKKIYLDSQNVKLDLRRFRKRLHRAYEYTVLRSNLNLQHQPQ